MPDRGSITIDPQGATVSVDVLLRGTRTTVYSSATGGAVSLPAEMSTVTRLWVPRVQAYTVVVSLNDVEVLRREVGVDAQAAHDPTVVVSLAEFTTGEANGALGGGGGGVSPETVYEALLPIWDGTKYELDPDGEGNGVTVTTADEDPLFAGAYNVVNFAPQGEDYTDPTVPYLYMMFNKSQGVASWNAQVGDPAAGRFALWDSWVSAGDANAIWYAKRDGVQIGQVYWEVLADANPANDFSAFDYEMVNTATSSFQVGVQDGTPILRAEPGKLGVFGATPVTKRTGVAVTAGGIHAALVSYGLIAA